jgi:lysophospholipase L1-like esterase
VVVRTYISGATLLVAGLLIGVLVSPTVRGPAGLDQARADALPSTSASPGGKATASIAPAANPAATPPVDRSQPVVVGFGDSITYIPFSWFRQVCTAGVVLKNCANAGITGNTTTQMVARVNKDVLAYRPSLVVVMGGTNDLRKGVRATAIVRRLDIIVGQIKATGAKVVLCTIPPRVNFEQQALALNVAIRSYAAAGGVPLLDLYSSVGNAKGDYRRGLSIDGIHPTRRGEDLMTAVAVKQLPALLGGAAQPLDP